jgi:hypothetical protein
MTEILNPITTATPIERSIISENFMTLSFTVSEKMEIKAIFEFFNFISHDRK